MRDQYAEKSLRSTSGGAPTPYSTAANQSGATGDEMKEAARRAHDIMFAPQ
jgi:hypothetical protein